MSQFQWCLSVKNPHKIIVWNLQILILSSKQTSYKYDIPLFTFVVSRAERVKIIIEIILFGKITIVVSLTDCDYFP